MTRFEDGLRRGLMDANLAQFEPVLRDADSMEPYFSPGYLRERTRLLADPWGWMQRRELTEGRPGRRVNWRLIALVAVLLLLSACAVAVVTGQFSQWFPQLRADPDAPEQSEAFLGRTGTVIEQSQTVNGETVTLHAAVWDGETLLLSLSSQVPDLSEKVSGEGIPDYRRCWLKPVEGQWEDYIWADVEAYYKDNGEAPTREDLEEFYQYWIEKEFCFRPSFFLLGRDGTTLNFEVRMELLDYLDAPQMTLHLENILAEDGEKVRAYVKENGLENGGELPYFNFGMEIPVLKGPFDFTFTLGEPVRPVRYAADIPVDLDGIPLRFTEFKFMFYQLQPHFEILAPVDCVCAEQLGKPMSDPDLVEGKRIDGAVEDGELVRGFWTSDGGYVDCSGSCGETYLHSAPDWTTADSSFTVKYPHIVDPATVTAVNLAGKRVELSQLERMDG